MEAISNAFFENGVPKPASPPSKLDNLFKKNLEESKIALKKIKS